MDAVELITLLTTGTLVAPFLTAVINRPQWNSNVKQAVAMAVSIGLAVAVLAVTDSFSGGVDVAASIGLVLGIASLAYNALWKPTGIAPAIEVATSPESD